MAMLPRHAVIYHGAIMQPPIARFTMATYVVVALATCGCAARVGPDGQPLAGDALIVAEVQQLIDEDDDIVGADLRVESRQGVVIISGVQASVEHLGELFRSIARVRGVDEVINRVRILRSAEEDLGRL